MLSKQLFSPLAGSMSALLLLAGIAAPLASFAQSDDDALEEIVVTAQNREQDVTDVPIAIDVLSRAQIEKAGLVDINGISRLAPALNITTDTNATRFTMRGVGTQSNDEAQDQALTVNIDGEYINRMRVLNAAMFDIQRVEVLRGPQGTLYGRNATGGAINIITNKPTLDGLEGYVTLGVGNYSAFNAQGAVNFGLGDKAAIRVAGMSAQHDGYNYHPNTNTTTGDQDINAARVGFLAEPTDALSIYLAAEFVEEDRNNNNYAFVNFNAPGYEADSVVPGTCSGPGWEEFAPLIPDVQCIPQDTTWLGTIDRNSYDGALGGAGSYTNDGTAIRGELSYDFGNLAFTYRGGYRESDVDIVSPLPVIYTFYRGTDVETFSNELRLNGGSDSGLFWQAGVFFFNEKQNTYGGLYLPVVGPNGSLVNSFYRDPMESKSKAIFGQVDIPLADQFTLLVGARYTDDEKDAVYKNFGFQFNSGPTLPDPDDAPEVLNLSMQNDETTWTLGLNWNPDDETLVYGKISSGYKAGGFDNAGSYQPESLLAYEIGTKTEFNDGRFLFDGAAFYYDYDDLQAAVLINPAIGSQTFNVGKATIYGVEGNFDLLLTENDRLTFSANYLSAEYDEFDAAVPVQCLGCDLNTIGDLDPGPAVVPPNLAGNTPPQAPEWTLTLGYDHIWELSGGASITGSLFSRYKTEYHNSIFNFNDDLQDGYSQTDASIQFVSESGQWRIQAYVRNIEDERQLEYGSFVSAGPDDIFNWFFGAPRTYGLQATLDF